MPGVNKRNLVSLAASLVALGACGADESVAVDRPWARATVEAQPHGAVYFDLTVDEADVLVGASIEPSIADHAEIHEVVESDAATEDESGHLGAGDDAADHGDAAPGMMMRQVEGGLELIADETIVFAPGGYHVMLLDLVEPLEVGDEFDLTLEFANSDDVTVEVPVEETAP
jgi:periplasmic copper chaperone A